MPQTLGPFTLSSSPALVPGASFPVPVNRAAQAIQVHNDTPYRLYFQFDGPQPTALDSMNGSYVGMCRPWASPVIPVQRNAASARERALNAISDFQGILWIMVVDATPNLAQTGSISQLREIHLDVYLPGEAWPQAWAMPRQQDIVSQPRIVTVPTAISHFYVASWSGVGTATVATLPMNAAQIAAGLAPVYLYYALCTPNETTTGVTRFIVQMQWQDISSANLGSPFIFASGAVFANSATNAATPWVFAPPQPLGAVGPAPSGAVKAVIQIVKSAGTPIALAYNILISMDFHNVSGTAEIGQTPFNGASQPLF